MAEEDKVAGSANGADGKQILTPETAQKTAAGVQAPSNQAPQASGPKPPPFMMHTVGSRERFLNMLIYGEFGTGKTHLAATSVFVPQMRDVLFADAESGELAIEDFPNIEAVTISNFAQFARLYEYLRLHCHLRDTNDLEKLAKTEIHFKGLELPRPDMTDDERKDAMEMIKANPRKFRTVIIDSLTEVQKYCMYQLLGIKVGVQALDVEPENAQFAEWGKSAEMIRLLVRTFRDLKMNSIFVCSKQEDQDHIKRIHHKPALPGKLANEVQGFLDCVGFYVAAPADGGEQVRRLYLTPGVTYQAKNRFRKFAASKTTFIENPSMQSIWDLR